MRATFKLLLLAAAYTLAGSASAETRTGKAAYGDWKTDAPGVVRKITAADMPPADPKTSAVAPSSPTPRPEGALPKTLPGFAVQAFAKLDQPRLIRIAPNGDIFVAESEGGKIKVLRAKDGAATPTETSTFAEGLSRPFGIAFYPAGPNPEWVYVAETDAVIRYPYKSGDLKARAAFETLVPKLTLNHRDHWTRDILFSPDGKSMLVTVGSASNTAESMPKKNPDEVKTWEKDHGFGTAWGNEEDRADVLAFDPLGKGKRVFASGIRNCVTAAINPATKDLWCSTNERDGLGDNVPPDYITRVKPGGFYGWPWFYIGDHEDPRHRGERPDLAGKTIMPDILIQPHSAPLGMTFYPATVKGVAAFPQAYEGEAFVALHGSWNRSLRTGYKVVMAKLKNGLPTGEYEDFLTGFVKDDASVWGRPVGVAIAHDGALLVSDDGSGWVWRIAPSKGAH